MKISKDFKENLEVLSATFFLPFVFVLGIGIAVHILNNLFS